MRIFILSLFLILITNCINAQIENVFPEIYKTVVVDENSRLLYGHSVHSVDKFTILENYVIFYSAYERKLFLLDKKTKVELDHIKIDDIKGIKLTNMPYVKDGKQIMIPVPNLFLFYNTNQELRNNSVGIGRIFVRGKSKHLIIYVKKNKLKYKLIDVLSNFPSADNFTPHSNYYIINDSISVLRESYSTKNNNFIKTNNNIFIKTNKNIEILTNEKWNNIKKIDSSKFVIIRQYENFDSLLIYRNASILSKHKIIFPDAINNFHKKVIYDNYSNNLYIIALDSIRKIYKINIKKLNSEIHLVNYIKFTGDFNISIRNDTLYYLRQVDGVNYLYLSLLKNNFNASSKHYSLDYYLKKDNSDSIVILKDAGFEDIIFEPQNNLQHSTIKELVTTVVDLLQRGDLLTCFFKLSAYKMSNAENISNIIKENNLDFNSNEKKKAIESSLLVYKDLLSNFENAYIEKSNSLYTLILEKYVYFFYEDNGLFYMFGYNEKK